MKKSIVVIICSMLIFSMSVNAQKNEVSKARNAISDMKREDPGISKFFETSYGCAVFPAIGKGAFGVGGATGRGTLFKSGEPVADARMTQVTIGFQMGGQKYAEIIFFEDERAFRRFIKDNFEFAAQVSAVALTSGASADAEYSDGILVFTMAIGGLMYEASIGGQKFSTEMYEEQ